VINRSRHFVGGGDLGEPGACRVEKLHAGQDSGAFSIIVVQDTTENIAPMNGA
jgi:hypothetical protein